MLSRLATIMGAITLTGGIAATAYWAGTTTSTDQPPPQQPTAANESTRTTDTGLPPSTPASTPEAAAQAWLATAHTRSWRDPSPHAWVGRTEPHLTGEALRAARQARTGHGGADWHHLATHRCSHRVTDIGSVIPPEAPRTEATVYVQVRGTLVEDCADGAVAADPRPLTATLELTRSDQGTWQVSSQLF